MTAKSKVIEQHCDATGRPQAVCPCEAHSSLTWSDDNVTCATCRRKFPIVNGIPILLIDEKSIFSISDYTGSGSFAGALYATKAESTTGLRGLYRRFANWLMNYGIPQVHMSADMAVKRVQAENPEASVLVIGCGDTLYENDRSFVYTDVSFGRRAAYVCDAHDLPFTDGSFDVVLLIAVMEHVMDPHRCVDEVWRILKSDGHVYAVTPFLQPVHMGAHDFTRFTFLGHRRLFRKFDDVDSGVALGPGWTMAVTMQGFLMSFTDNQRIRQYLKLIALLISLPIKWMDVFFRKNMAAYDMAGGLFFFGRKRADAVSDREILKAYRGAIS